MKFIKEMQAKYLSRDKEIGEVSFSDGLCDVTDPGYDRDTWCALHDVKILPGMYKAFIDEVNFPSVWEWEEGDVGHVIGQREVMNDVRIMTLTIIHKNYVDNYIDGEYHKYKLSDNIGVDAGMCGFYNHKPDFKEDHEWDKFWQSLDRTEHGHDCDCHHANGVTVSSGFGDGVYTVYKITHNRKVIGLQLQFN